MLLGSDSSLQHQHAAPARPGDVVLQFLAIPGYEIVGLFDHHQPVAAEHGHGCQLVEHVAQQRGAAGKGPQRELAFLPAEHRRPQRQNHLPAQERLVAKYGTPAEPGLLRGGKIVERREFLGHAVSA